MGILGGPRRVAGGCQRGKGGGGSGSRLRGASGGFPMDGGTGEEVSEGVIRRLYRGSLFLFGPAGDPGGVEGAHRAYGGSSDPMGGPANSHMLVSKIKPCMSHYKLLYGETANGSSEKLHRAGARPAAPPVARRGSSRGRRPCATRRTSHTERPQQSYLVDLNWI